MGKTKKRMIGDLEGFSDEMFEKAKEHKDIFAFCESIYNLGYIPKDPRVTYMKKYWISVDCGEPDTEDGGGYEDYQKFQVPFEVEKNQVGACKIYICDAVGLGYDETHYYEGMLEQWDKHDHPYKYKLKQILEFFTHQKKRAEKRARIEKQKAFEAEYKKVINKLKKELQ